MGRQNLETLTGRKWVRLNLLLSDEELDALKLRAASHNRSLTLEITDILSNIVKGQ